MSDYPRQVWKTSDGQTYDTEAEAKEASIKSLTLEHMAEHLTVITDDTRLGCLRFFVDNRQSLNAAYSIARDYAADAIRKNP